MEKLFLSIYLMSLSYVLDSWSCENEQRESIFTSGMNVLFLPKLGSCKRVIISTSGDFERGSLLMLLLLSLDQAELSSQVDKDLCSARGKLSSRNKKPRGTKTTICQNTHLKTTKQPKKSQWCVIASCTPDYQAL